MKSEFNFLIPLVAYMRNKVHSFLILYEMEDLYDNIVNENAVDDQSTPQAILFYIEKIANNTIVAIAKAKGIKNNEVCEAFYAHYLHK